jgi:dolichol-phosphate mannosyltransferase
MARRIHIILPVYNEERALEPLLTRIRSAMTAMAQAYAVIVVDDGSADRSGEIARAWRAAMPLDLVEHERNRGLGAALRSGLLRAASLAGPDDVIVTMDADDTHPPDLIGAMVRRLDEGADVVIASRYVAGAREVGLSARRRVLSRGAGAVLGALFPVAGARDYSCGFRAYRASVIARALAAYGPALVEERGFACAAEVLLKLRRLGVRVSEVPLVLRYDQKKGASKMRVLRTISRYGVLVTKNLREPGGRPFRHIASGAGDTGARAGSRPA